MNPARPVKMSPAASEADVARQSQEHGTGVAALRVSVAGPHGGGKALLGKIASRVDPCLFPAPLARRDGWRRMSEWRFKGDRALVPSGSQEAPCMADLPDSGF